MGRPVRRKRMHKNIKDIKKKYRTRRRTKDLDQIHDDLKSEQSTGNGLLAEDDPDLPGSGRHYCLTCARYFVDEKSMKDHLKTKLHKRRLKALKEPVYSQKEAEAAAGMGNYVLHPPDTMAAFQSTDMETVEPA